MANLRQTTEQVTSVPSGSTVNRTINIVNGVYVHIKNKGSQQVSYEFANTGERGVLNPSESRGFPSNAEFITDDILLFFEAPSIIQVDWVQSDSADSPTGYLEQIANNTGDPRPSSQTDYYLRVPLNEIPGQRYDFKFGRNSDVDQADTPADVWQGKLVIGGPPPYNYQFPTGASILDIESTSPADTDGDGGAWSILVQGLDANFEEIEETVLLDGTNVVNTTNAYIRVNRVVVLQAGGLGGNDGIIQLIYGTGSGVPGAIAAVIDESQNQTLQAIYTVPANKTAVVLGGFTTVNRRNNIREADFSFRVRPENSVFQTKIFFGIAGGNSQFIMSMRGGFAIPERSDMKLCCEFVSQGGTDASGGWEMFLFDN
jgi:hypothetical protein